MKQTKISDLLRQLPENKQQELLKEERRREKIEMKEMQQKLWKN